MIVFQNSLWFPRFNSDKLASYKTDTVVVIENGILFDEDFAKRTVIATK